MWHYVQLFPTPEVAASRYWVSCPPGLLQCGSYQLLLSCISQSLSPGLGVVSRSPLWLWCLLLPFDVTGCTMGSETRWGRAAPQPSSSGGGQACSNSCPQPPGNSGVLVFTLTTLLDGSWCVTPPRPPRGRLAVENPAAQEDRWDMRWHS